MATSLLLAVFQLADPLAVVVDRIRPDQDIQHYHIAVDIPDSGTQIRGATTVRYFVRDGLGPLVLDFDEAFAVDSVVPHGARVQYPQVRDGVLRVAHWGPPGVMLEVTIHYHGVPVDGLFIQDNVHGHRTAFADNFPDRARHWFPSEDHPSDKATVSYAVEVPNGWRAIANGALGGVDTLSTGRTVWHWREDRKIPVYTMVIGAGRMSVSMIGEGSGLPQSVWTFPEDSAYGASQSFERAAEMVQVYSSMIGPYPYEKLAHVQSSTRFGGMENSSAIFYSERAFAAQRVSDGLLAHEVAHQWFGDGVTEYDWHHAWLSEGFASYFGPLYFEAVGDQEEFAAALVRMRNAVLGSDVRDKPIIDTTVTEYMQILNANTYQKGASVLHMLRKEIGDSTFFRGIREYYLRFSDSTALSSDLRDIMERKAGRSLDWFFRQWLLQAGYPQMEVSWSYNGTRRSVSLEFRQVQPQHWGVYRLDVDVLLQLSSGDVVSAKTHFDGIDRSTHIEVRNVGSKPDEIVIDAMQRLLLLEVLDISESPNN